jgi:capsular exopolysaccharide synthesis family protein
MRQQLAQQEYAQSTSELTRTRGEIREITTQLAHLESGKTTGFTVSKEEIRSAIDREPAIAQELARLEAMDRVIDREAERYVQGRKAAGLQTLIKEMTDARAFLEKKKVELTQSMQHRLQEEKARAAALNATNLKQRLSYLQNLEKLLVADCERLSKASRQLNDGALKVEDVRHEMEEADKMLRTIQHKVETMEIEMDAPPRIRTFDGGESTVQVPDESLRRLTFGGMAALGGFAVVALGIGLLEIRIRRLSGPADVVEHLGLPVLGKLPFCKGGKGRTAAIRQNMLKEAVDSTRTILLSGGARGCRTILVGSPVSGEGKTSLSCHLAASLGRAGRRVLLIDGDLRKPDVHKVFGQVNNQGLCGVLRNEESLENLVLPSGLPGLWILPAGRSNEDALRGLADGNFQLLLDQAKEQFDFILIDSPPLLTVSDGLVKATSVDGVIFAAFEGKTQISRLLDAISQVTSAGVRVLGVIINGVKGDEPSSYKDYSRYLETPATATNN